MKNEYGFEKKNLLSSMPRVWDNIYSPTQNPN